MLRAGNERRIVREGFAFSLSFCRGNDSLLSTYQGISRRRWITRIRAGFKSTSRTSTSNHRADRAGCFRSLQRSNLHLQPHTSLSTMPSPTEIKSCCVSGRTSSASLPTRPSLSPVLTGPHPAFIRLFSLSSPFSDIHSGTPKGTESTVYGLPAYVALPEDKDKAKTAIFLTDIFVRSLLFSRFPRFTADPLLPTLSHLQGYKLVNARLLADEWASNGYHVIVPDIFSGDWISDEYLNVIVPNLREQERKGIAEKAADSVTMMAQYGPWAAKHRDAGEFQTWLCNLLPESGLKVARFFVWQSRSP